MKNIMFFLIASSMILAEGISGLSYFRYTPSGSENRENHGFHIDRVYFTYKKDVSDKVSFKFQSDVQNKGDEAFYMYIKNAKMDYKVSDNTKLTIGLQGMNMFNIQEKTWGNRFLSKSAMDLNKWSASADLGLGVSQSFGSIFLSALYTNGEGYKKTASDIYEKLSVQAVYGEKRLDKKDGFNVGGVFSSLVYEVEDDLGTPDDETEEKKGTVMGIFAGFSGAGARLGFEYNMGTDLDLDYADEGSGYGESSSLMSICANYNLPFDLPFSKSSTLFLRYDMLDAGVEDNTDTDLDESIADDKKTLLAGLIFKCIDGIEVSPNMTMITIGDADPESSFNLTFQLKF